MSDEVGVEQISAEQILKEVYKKRKVVKPSAKVDILDLEELKEYQRRKRNEYETYLKRSRLDMGQWIRYALFEIDQHDIRRARSVFERALLVNNGYVPLWIRYVDSELKLKFINHARNLLDRAINTLPRVDKFWYKYLLVEESLGNVEIVRSLFTKWISLEPNTNAWDTFIDFEIRQENWENARSIYAKYVLVHPQVSTWRKWVHFESINGDVDMIRKVYSLAVDTLVSFQSHEMEGDLISLILSFATWEASQQEYERCRALYRIATEKWPQNKTLKDSMVDFEKRFGNISSAEESVIFKRRRHYEERLKEDPRNFGTWWLYLDVIQNYFQQEMLECLERSVTGNQPLESNKSVRWKQYLYLWIRLLTYVELDLNNIELCRKLYLRLVDEIIPHKHFTFSKIWIMFAKFEIRQGDLTKARKILGKSLGICPKRKTFQGYIELETRLKQFDRVRKLYEKYLEFDSSDVTVWINYAELEENLGDEDRCRAIYDIAITNSVALNFSEESRMTLMQRFIEFETDAEEFGKGRELYERFLHTNGNSAKLWINYALYESSTPTEEQLQHLLEAAESDDGDIEFETTDDNRLRSREIFEKALKHFKRLDDKESRAAIFEAYRCYEEIYGTSNDREALQKRMPRMLTEQGPDGKEQRNYVFPDDSNTTPNVSKFFALANKWNEGQSLADKD